MTLLHDHHPTRINALHCISFTNGASARCGMDIGSTGRAYLHPASRGSGFHLYIGAHQVTVASTAAAETFITGQLGGTIP